MSDEANDIRFCQGWLIAVRMPATVTTKAMLKTKLERIATAFRLGLEQAPWPYFMSAFPRGCCGMASDLLGLYLIDSGIGTAHYICGEKRKSGKSQNFTSHAWLVFNGITIDISGDQFDDVSVAVIVSESSEWHRKWTINEDQCHVVGGWRPDNEFAAVYASAKEFADRTLRANPHPASIVPN